MHTFYAVVIAVAALTLSACEEEREATGPSMMPVDSAAVAVETPSPTVSALASSVPTIVKFGVEVAADQAQDTVHYLVLRDTTEAPTPMSLLEHAENVALPMDGNRFRTGVWSELQEQTQYVVYALLKNDERISEIASVSTTTGKAE